MELSCGQMLEMYRRMRTIRAFEDRVGELYINGHIWGAVHLCTGEEATAVGACMALRPDDYITSTHRGHGHCIAKGADLKAMMAEIFGRATGYCLGKGGSMHIANVEGGNLGANAIVGDGIAIAVGAALGCRIRSSHQVSLTFFGDGATGTGAFHEAVNLAAVLKLAVVFLCENNQYAVSTHVSTSCPVPRLAQRAAGYGIPSETINGNDVLLVFETVKDAAERARRGEGPTLIEAMTYRWEGHYKGDPEVYRMPEEVAEWREKRDPLALFARNLMAEAGVTDEEIKAVDLEVMAAIGEAVDYAMHSPEPSLDSLHRNLYAE